MLFIHLDLADASHHSPPHPIIHAPRQRQRFTLPVRPPVHVLNHFRTPRSLYGAGNRGIDFATTPGQAVYAPAAGVIVFNGTINGIPTISIDHDHGIRTTYQPVTGPIGQGERVTAGQLLGEVTEARNGHLHWGARISRLLYFDPMELLLRPVALIE